MSEERVKKIFSTDPARPNPSSIMSAPRDKKKTERTFILIGALIISLALNITLAVIFITKNEKINALETEIKDNEALILELKTKVNSLSSF
ncbi:hypothetical protein IIZ77_00100 [Candidatus Saccharibacteria bacterium]|nr:hypothetical protein [Candidatus Saccharibacteria bacterium]